MKSVSAILGIIFLLVGCGDIQEEVKTAVPKVDPEVVTTTTTIPTTTTTVNAVNVWLWMDAAKPKPEPVYIPEPEPVYTPEPEVESYSTGSGACGGDLPPCYVMQIESGGVINIVSPNGMWHGKWQFVDSTWGGYGGYAHASDAPEDVQDAKAREIWAGGAGCGHWNAC